MCLNTAAFPIPMARPSTKTMAVKSPGVIRAPGGWLSDRFGARTVMYWVLAICVVTSFLLMLPDVEMGLLVPARYAASGEGPRFAFRMGPYAFTAIVFVLGLAMGIGKAAVFKHIPHYFPESVGSVGGLVGVIGGLGGFVMPILFGWMSQTTRLPTTTFAFLFLLSIVCLVWMQVVITRMSREAAPLIAEELEAGPVAHPSPPPAA